MKPPPPPKELSGPTFIHPKAPRYLPKQLEPKWEIPKLKKWERPKKEDPGHTVLWLFLEEKGEQVIDERWGTDEEERENLSRNESRETDRCSVGSSRAECESGRESQLSTRCEDSTSREKQEPEELGGVEVAASGAIVTEGGRDSPVTEHQERTSNRIAEEEIIHEEEYIKKEEKKSKGKLTVSSHLLEQLNDIQSQIEELEEEAPSDLQSQLLAVKEQLSKILQIKAQVETTKQITESSEKVEENIEHIVEESIEEKLIETEKEGLLEVEISGGDTILKSEEHIEQTKEIEEICEVEEIVRHVEMSAEMEMSYDYEVCEAAPQKKRTALPLTPQLRPIVLPGGRMWRQPKDAAHEDLYTGVLVSQAEVLVGSTVGINFTKYVPPKFDMSHSAVYRLIHEIEDRTQKGAGQKEKAVAESDYHNPISKRHFYLASLPEPRPIGAVELSELKCS